MELKGLCSTCVELKVCVFAKEPPVWQCEEFSSGSYVASGYKQPKVKKATPCEETIAE